MSIKYTEVLQIVGSNNLYWSEDEGKYLLLSTEETRELVNKCMDSGVIEVSDIVKIIRAYEDILSGSAIFRNFLNGDLTVRVTDGEIYWTNN